MSAVTVLRAVLVAACACLPVAWPRAAAAGPSDTIIFVGLRPASDRAYKKTEIRRLTEAQRLRTIPEEVTRELTRRTVLNHAALRTALGSAYLVKFMDCLGEVRCVSGALAALRLRSKLATYGDYSIANGRYRVRMRVVDIVSVKLVAEVEFSLRTDELEDRERWTRELSVLYGSVVGAVSSSTGQGATGSAGSSEGADQAASDGEAATDTDAAGASSSGRDTDELTDADFGVVAPPVASVPVPTRPPLPWLEVSAGVSLLSRRFRYDSEPGVERSDGFKSAWTSRAGGVVAVYPLSSLGHERLAGFGLLGGFARTLSTGDGSSSVRDTKLQLGLAYRIAIGRSALYPSFQVSAGYLREDVVVLDPSVDFPDTSYRGAALGGDVRVPVLTPRVAINAGFRYLVINEAGEIVAPGYYGRSKVGGLELEGSIEVQPLDLLFVRVGGSYTGYDLELGDNGEQSNLGAIGGRDRVVAFTVTTGLFL